MPIHSFSKAYCDLVKELALLNEWASDIKSPSDWRFQLALFLL